MQLHFNEGQDNEMTAVLRSVVHAIGNVAKHFQGSIPRTHNTFGGDKVLLRVCTLVE